jgi:hypothetical protein
MVGGCAAAAAGAKLMNINGTSGHVDLCMDRSSIE